MRARRLQADRHDRAQARHTVDRDGQATTLEAARAPRPVRAAPRAVPIVEAMMALVLADHYLRQRGQMGFPGTAPGMGEAR